MNGNELAARRGDGTVRHPGMVPSLEARAREAARAAQQADEAHTNLA